MRAVNIQWDTDGLPVSLPSEIKIPDDIDTVDDISDYISDSTGFCHNGFELTERGANL